jgi:HD-GYP domain-containing protein (c-di-GMP phosphodiesterase class II)
MHILLLQENVEVREKMVFLLESTYGATAYEAASFGEALALLQKGDPKMNLIILDSKNGSANDIESFRKESEKIPTLLSIQGTPEGFSKGANIVGVIDRTTFIEKIVGIIDDLIEKGVLSASETDQGQVRIKTKLLLSVCPLQGDIYIRLSKNKFVKLFKQGDVFDLQDLEKYTIKKGVEYLYIRQEQCQEFAQKYLNELQKLLLSENLTVEDVGKLNQSVHETVHELTSKMGFTKEIQEMTKTQVQLTVKSMGKDPSLAEILAKLDAAQGQYIASHSTLCAYLACAIASQLQWGSETTFYKLSLASFLHDVTLNNQTLAEIQSLEELEQNKSKFTEKELKEFKEHPAQAAEMAKKMTEVPPDVDTIIRQHHERPDGTGFPRKLGHSYIAPLACVFIVAHDLTRYTLTAGASFEMETYLKGVRDKYKSSQFKKILSSLEVLNKIKEISSEIQQKKNTTS